MAGLIESPYSADELATLPDGSNVYGDDTYEVFDPNDPYHQEAWANAANIPPNTVHLRPFHPIPNVTPPTQQPATPRSRDPPASQPSLAMVTAREHPLTPDVPTDISFPSTQPSTTQTTVTAPSRPPTVTFTQTPKTTNVNNNIQPTSTHSVRSRDPPEEVQTTANQSSTLISYASASVQAPNPTQPMPRVTSPISVHSQSTISSHRPHPSASAPPFHYPQPMYPQYASRSEVDRLRQELQNFKSTTNIQMGQMKTDLSSMSTSLSTVSNNITHLTNTIGSTITDNITAAMRNFTTQAAPSQPTQPTPVNQSTNVAPTVQQPSHQASPSPSTTALQTLIEKLDTSHLSSKAVFPTYHPKMDVQKWKTTCLMKLDAHKSPHYNSFVTRNNKNECIFNNNLT